jgi:hypothetical protein
MPVIGVRRPGSYQVRLEDVMQAFKFVNLGILATLLASSAVLYAQDEKPQDDKPAAKQEVPKGQVDAKPAAKQDDMKAPKQDEAKPAKPDQPEKQEAQPRDDKKPTQPEAARPEAARPENERQEPARQDAARPDNNARPAANNGRIPDDRFRSNFGREHSFRMPRPELVSGRPQFQYGGYSFVLVDAWPAEWAYSDDCYIDYINGEYFLIDLRHPGVQLALTVVM